MHIVQLNYAYDPAFPDPDALLGRFATLVEWSEALLAAGATRVTVGQRFWRDCQLRRAGVDYIFRADGGGPYPRGWTWPRRLHREVAALRPDVAHVNGLLFPAQTWLLRRALPRDTVLVIQDHAGVYPSAKPIAKDTKKKIGGRIFRALRELRARPVRFALERVGLRAADGFMFVAAAQAQPWRDAGLIGPRQRVYAVMEASRTLSPLPRAAARAASGLPGDPALLWVGRLNSNKDPLTVLAGFERALPYLPGAHLTLIYGSDELLPQVQARLSEAAALAGRVHLLGHMSYAKLAAFYSAADMFVLGSYREGSGYALIEALACGAIPVVTDIPSFRAITGGGAVGALWPPGDAAALAAALIELGRRDLAPLHAAAYAHFECTLSWDAVGRRALAVYDDLLAH